MRTFRRGILSRMRWRTRIVLWTFAAIAGLVVVVFAKLADTALELFHRLHGEHAWLTLLICPAIGAVVVWATGKYFPGSQGSGIPQVIAATRLVKVGRWPYHLISLRIAFGKVCLGSFALVGGFSSGREGPSVQVAASILHHAHRYLPDSRMIRASDLVLAGGAAGIAAAFNTPLAGIVFVIEELGRRLESRTSGVLLGTIIIAGLMAMTVTGNYNYFGRIQVPSIDLGIVMPVLISGVSCGLIGGGFSLLLLWPQKHPNFVLWRWRNQRPVLFAAGCGLCVAAIGIASGGLSFGSGYVVTSRLVSGDLELPWYASMARYLATLVTYYSGVPGGVFAPSLAVGAAWGNGVSQVLGGGYLVWATLCMAAFLAAVTQSPITAAIIVMEMVDGHEMVLSLMAVTLIARAVSSRISPELYQQLAVGFLQGDDKFFTGAKAHTKPLKSL